MTRYDMLNEHLNVIHVIEQLNFSKLKSKVKQIGDAAASGNILAFNRVMDTIPDISLDQLKSVSRKKFGPDYKKNEKYIDINMKKAPDKIKDAMTLARTSLMRIKSESKDPDVQAKVGEKVDEMDTLLKKIKIAAATGLTLAVLANILEYYFGMTSLIVPFLGLLGFILLYGAIIIYVIRFFVKLFIESKKKGRKVTV